ncbi:MAG TPA: 3-isopropylmalate dehydrogenase [Bacillota bacterium]|jgi:3-isopropylmalate dehydrogenase
MIAVLSGDGIGPEVCEQAIRALRAAGDRFGLKLTFEERPFGGKAIDETGVPLPEETLAACRRAHAVLLGAAGGPKWDGLPPEIRPERGLLDLRQEMRTFANLRPVYLPEVGFTSSPLRPELTSGGIDVLVVRELTGGLYFGDKKRWDGNDPGASDVLSYTVAQIERIARVAFGLAGSRRGRVTSVDKANVLLTSRLWREVVTEVAADYPEIELDHMYVDNCAHLMVRDPRRFDVILTENTFGDILSDLGGGLVGSLGLLPSASLGEGGPGIYEPVHGSAPDIAGRSLANPCGAILSVAMLARFSLGREDIARVIEDAVWSVLADGVHTSDLTSGNGHQPVSTEVFGDLVIREINQAGANDASGSTDGTDQGDGNRGLGRSGGHGARRNRLAGRSRFVGQTRPFTEGRWQM